MASMGAMRTTILLAKPPNAAPRSTTPVAARTTQQVIVVTPNGTLCHTNITIIKRVTASTIYMSIVHSSGFGFCVLGMCSRSNRGHSCLSHSAIIPACRRLNNRQKSPNRPRPLVPFCRDFVLRSICLAEISEFFQFPCFFLFYIPAKPAKIRIFSFAQALIFAEP